MITQKLQKRYRAALTTLESMVAAVDIDAMEEEVRQDVTMELLDKENPTVNGVELLKHPYRSAEFESVVKSGGRIAVIKFKGVVSTIVTRTTSGGVAINLEEFASQLGEYQSNQLVGRVGELLKGNFDKVRGKPSRPKSMTPDDFWVQFTDRELEGINTSLEADVIELITYINGLKKVNITSKKVKATINYLYVNKFISRRTKERFD